MAERKYTRRFPRRRFREKIGVLHKGEYAMSGAVEIGEGGMLLKPESTPVIGDLVTVNFFIPAKDFITVMGQIIYKRGTEFFGVRFLDLDFNSKRIIRDYIALKTAVEALEEVSD